MCKPVPASAVFCLATSGNVRAWLLSCIASKRTTFGLPALSTPPGIGNRLFSRSLPNFHPCQAARVYIFVKCDCAAQDKTMNHVAFLQRFGKSSAILLIVSACAFADPEFDRLISSGKFSQATSYADSAIPAASRSSDIWVKLGIANAELGYLDRSLACYMVGSRLDQKNPVALCGIAAVYNRMGSHSKALTFAGKSVAIQPSADGERQYAIACNALGKHDAAQSALQKALELEPGNVSLLRALAALYWQEGAHDKAMPLLRAAYTSSPNAGEAFRIGESLLQSNKPDSAIVFLKDALGRNPALFDADLALARAYYRKEKFLASAAEFEKTLDKGIMTPRDFYDRAVALEKSGDSTALFDAYKAAATAYGSAKSAESGISHLKTGYGELAQKHFASALAHFKMVAVIDTGRTLAPDLNVSLGEAYAGKHDFAQAIACLELERTVGRANPVVLARLAELYQRTHAPDKATRIYNELAAAGKGDASLFIILGDDNMRAKRYADALSFYEKSQVLQSSARAACGTANAAAALEMWNKAIDNAMMAIRIDPSLSEPRIVAAQACLRVDHYKEAKEQLDVLVARSPAKVEYWEQLAFCCEKLGDNAGLALADQKTADLDKRNVEARLRLGAAMLDRKEYAKAFDLYKALAVLTPQNPEVYKALYSAATGLADNLKAATYLKKYCALVPTDVEALSRLGDLYLGMKSFGPALAAYRNAVAIDPTFKGLGKRYAEAALAHGTADESIRSLTIAIQDNEADAALCEKLGALLEKKGMYWKAITYDSMALHLEPNTTGLTLPLARCLYKSGRAGDALECLRSAVRANLSSTDEYKLMGDIFVAQKKPDSSFVSYSNYLAKKPLDTSVAMTMARYALANQKCKEALACLSPIHDPMTGKPNYEFLYGSALYYSRDYAGAIPHLQAAAKAPDKGKDRRVSLFRMLAESYDIANDTTLAVAAYKRYISAAAAPDPNASYRLAKLSESTDPSLAGRMYERNAARFPADYRNYFDAAREYSRQSATYDKAITMIQKCISIRDTVPYLWLVLGRIYGKRNATSLELKAYQNYLLGEANNAGTSRGHWEFAPRTRHGKTGCTVPRKRLFPCAAQSGVCPVARTVLRKNRADVGRVGYCRKGRLSKAR